MKKKLKTSSIIYKLVLSGSFVLIIFSIFIGNIIKKDNDISYLENRNLKQKPQITFDSVFSGEFATEFEEYISDQFINRDFWIKFKSNLELLIGKDMINNVYVAEDDYLIENFKVSSSEENDEKINAINSFAEKNKDLNTTMILVPTASEILDYKLPKYANVDSQLEYLNNVQNNLNEGINFINVYDELKEHNDEYIYYKTDHHWTTDGAYIAYKEMCMQLDMDYKDSKNYNIKPITNEFYGSLYYKLGAGIGDSDLIKIYIPKDEEKIVVNYLDEEKKTATLYNSESINGKDKYEVFTGGNHGLIHIKTMAESEKKLIIFKDSYANCFIPFVTSNYAEILVVDPRYYNGEIQPLIDEYDISDVLFLYNINTFNADKSILNIEE